jgi:Clp amino terminal domain, pathogenicity island component
VVPIDLKRFQESDVTLVECPDCQALRTFKPHGGVLRFKSHDRRKTTTPNTGQRWGRGETDWDVVGGYGKCSLYAMDEAERQGSMLVRIEHMLLSIVREGGGVAANVLDHFGVLGKVRQQTFALLGKQGVDSSS